MSDDKYKFDLCKISQEYRFGGRKLPRKPKLMTFYKGGLAEFLTAQRELISLAQRNSIEGRIEEVKRIIESENIDEIDRIINEHTSHYHNTALLSATCDFEKAISEAKRCKGHYEYEIPYSNPVVFELSIHPSRFIYDAKNIGRCGYKREIMILGKIFRDEVVNVQKIYI
ncbi:MAG: hypothetical protein LAT82_05075 [Nanoarchaeota archaeon]|nr:hypothetical protein [Nanoarchaeota archaeon]